MKRVLRGQSSCMGIAMKRPAHTLTSQSHRNAYTVRQSPTMIATNTRAQIGTQTHMERDKPRDTGQIEGHTYRIINRFQENSFRNKHIHTHKLTHVSPLRLEAVCSFGPQIKPRMFFSAQLMAEGSAGRCQMPAVCSESSSLALQPDKWPTWQVTDCGWGLGGRRGWTEADHGLHPAWVPALPGEGQTGRECGIKEEIMFALADAKGSVILANCECPGKGREDRAATDNDVNSGVRLCRLQRRGSRLSGKKGFITGRIVKCWHRY